MNFKTAFSIAIVFVLSGMINLPVASSQEMDAETKTKIKRVTDLVDRAGKAFKAKDFKDSARNIRSAQRVMVSLAKSGNEAVVVAMKKDFERLKKARTLLEKQSQKFDELPDLVQIAKDASEDAAMNDVSDAELVSFTRQVAPIIVEHCGQCHIQRKQGKYSAASYNDLKKGTRKGTAVKPNDIEKSRLITLVENGTMPPKRHGNAVPAEKLQLLKDWILQGAKFDGPNKDKQSNLSKFVSSQGSGSNNGGLGQPGTRGN